LLPILAVSVGFTSTPVPASRVVICEGIYALNERLKHLLDLRISIAGRLRYTIYCVALQACVVGEVPAEGRVGAYNQSRGVAVQCTSASCFSRWRACRIGIVEAPAEVRLCSSRVESCNRAVGDGALNERLKHLLDLRVSFAGRRRYAFHCFVALQACAVGELPAESRVRAPAGPARQHCR
jgi:hypothetical protein